MAFIVETVRWRERMGAAVLACFLVFAAPQAVQAACTAMQGGQADMPVVGMFQRLADALQTECPVFFNADGKGGGMIEYLPQGQSLESWQDKMTVSIIYTGGGAAAQLDNVKASLQEAFTQAGGEMQELMRAPGHDGQKIGLHYTVGEGAEAENAIAVIRTLADDKVAIIHWQKRGGAAHDEEDLRLFFTGNGISG